MSVNVVLRVATALLWRLNGVGFGVFTCPQRGTCCWAVRFPS
jgi:hypothetical protein